MHRTGIFFVGLLMFAGLSKAADETKKDPHFELKDGDRVVLLGGTLIEREQKYGHWETILTVHHPDRNITFRNLGWDGDTVWAESRGIFDPPEVGYARMIEQVKGLKPTVLILGYGNNEAFAGKEGLEPFVKQYEKLIDDLTKAAPPGVRIVLLKPRPLFQQGRSLPDPAGINRNIASYRDAVVGLAKGRKLVTLDWLMQWVLDSDQADSVLKKITDDSGHLTDHGYWVTGSHLKIEYSIASGDYRDSPAIVVKADGTVKEYASFKEFKVEKREDVLKFVAEIMTLPQSPPWFVFSGLPDGTYALSADGKVVKSATAKEWETLSDELALKQSPDHAQYEALRQAIIAKNELYFHSWRPQNVTYLFGFRKHEQGQNAKETAEFEKLVAEKEAEIAKLRKPVPHKYELKLEKPAK